MKIFKFKDCGKYYRHPVRLEYNRQGYMIEEATEEMIKKLTKIFGKCILNAQGKIFLVYENDDKERISIEDTIIIPSATELEISENELFSKLNSAKVYYSKGLKLGGLINEINGVKFYYGGEELFRDTFQWRNTVLYFSPYKTLEKVFILGDVDTQSIYDEYYKKVYL